MKTIKLSDDDYNKLMEFSKELQLQTNNGQAFPYFWEPSSEKLEVNFNNEGETIEIYHHEDSETYDLETFAEEHDSLWQKFIDDWGETYDIDKDDEWYNSKFSKALETEWYKFLERNDDGFTIFSSDWKRSRDHNPSLFLSDVKQYCESNQHHLGRKPSPYSDSIWRMPKMQNLVEIIYKLNPQKEDEVNQEAKRFVFKESK